MSDLVKSGKARSEHIPSGLHPRADIVDALWHFRFVPHRTHAPQQTTCAM
jgi:hypothetical protein